MAYSYVILPIKVFRIIAPLSEIKGQGVREDLQA